MDSFGASETGEEAEEGRAKVEKLTRDLFSADAQLSLSSSWLIFSSLDAGEGGAMGAGDQGMGEKGVNEMDSKELADRVTEQSCEILELKKVIIFIHFFFFFSSPLLSFPK